jgi:hypothetical protein
MMLLLTLLLAQAVPPPLAVDERPSALACTFDAALRGSKCIYEAAAGPGAARDNSKAASDAGLRACAVEARRDEGLRKECEKAVAEASLGAHCAIASRLTDEQGRLTAQAQGCVEAVREAVGRTARAAALSLECCKCLGESRCGVPAAQCHSELADLMPGASLKACLEKSCQDTCSFAAPPAREKAQNPAPENHADKI